MEFPCIIVDDRLHLEECEDKHVADLFEIYSNKSIVSYLNGKPEEKIDATKERVSQLQKKFVNGEQIYWVISDTSIDKAIGYITLLFFGESWQLEYALNEMYWNKHIMSKCLLSALKYFRSNTSEFIYATVNDNNPKSVKILRNLGFEFVKNIPNHSKHPTSPFEDLYRF